MNRNNIFYPWDQEKLEIIDDEGNFFKNGNFSLWFNKYIPLNSNSLEYGDAKGNKNNVVEHYKKVYDKTKDSIKDYLKNKHISQIASCRYFESINDYKYVVCCAKLKTGLITGLGQTHPSETGVALDRNIGIPYIPSSSIKGVVRFAFILSRFLEGKIDEDGKMDLDEFEKFIEIFGVGGERDIEDSKGGVIFLDAYPSSVPELKVDIMNPHYGEYYVDDINKTPPADYLSPVPIKFLTVKRGTEFVFRFVVKEGIADIALDTLKKAITQEGVGAKTALGYGLFEVIDYKDSEDLENEYEQYVVMHLTEEEKTEKRKQDFLRKVKDYSGNIDGIFDEWQKDDELKNDKEIAEVFLEKINKWKKNKEPTYHYRIIAEILSIDLDKKDKSEKSEISDSELLKQALADFDKYINKGKISKKEYKKLVSKYKEKFKHSKEINEKFSKLKKLIKK